MSDPDRAQEPSMEEILASIRRIISDDKKNPRSETDKEPAPLAEPEEEPRAPDVPVGEDDPLAAADAEDRQRISGEFEENREDEPAASPAETMEPGAAPAQAPAEQAAGEFDEPGAGYEATAEPAPEEAGFRERGGVELDAAFGLRGSADVEAAPRRDIDAETEEPAAMEEPAPIEEESRLISSRTDASVASAFASLENFVLSTHSRTLEDLVSEMLRPLLKAWLDANLPPLVERLVREEIERVSRGRR